MNANNLQPIEDSGTAAYELIRAIIKAGASNAFEVETTLEDRIITSKILGLPPFDHNDSKVLLAHYEAERLIKYATQLFKGGY